MSRKELLKGAIGGLVSPLVRVFDDEVGFSHPSLSRVAVADLAANQSLLTMALHVGDVSGKQMPSLLPEFWDELVEHLRQLMDTARRDIRDQTTYSPERFTPNVYQEVMADKPRLGGATAALAYFKVPDAANRAQAYGERKQQRVVELIEAGEFHAFPDALRFALAVKFTGLKLAAASSSKNADEFLKRIPPDVFAAERGLPYDFIHEGMTLLNLFDADISGRDFEHGKPHPMIFLTAPQELGFPP